MKNKAIAATTHIDKHNMRIAKEALENMAKDIRESGTVPAMKIEHDTIIPPIGKVIDGWVEKREDNEYQLVVIQEVFSNASEITLPDGTTALLESSESDKRPFTVNKETNLLTGLKISVDYANFESQDDYKKFRDEIKQAGEFEEGVIGRKSFIPDPEMIIAISHFLLATTVGKKVLEKLTDRIIDTVLDDTVPKAYEGIKKAVFSMAKYSIPKNRPITYVFLVSGIFNVQLVIRSNDPNKVMEAILQENLAEIFVKAQEFHEALDISEIQFLFSDKEEWEFNYLLTNKGEVIGSPASHSKRVKRIELLNQELGRNNEIL
ncbi:MULTISPECIES: hypothetical protein [Bacillus amyloliquefaciens group]|uniref:hypothetical protein n=1 Tax=Bacillus amyloliquefaciens group TaxID=1938374 RepID=UPI000B51A2AF|nr:MULTISPECIES: hypothetical protein [Bacillus amyloliquefaciens group]ASF29962.1 hypothetical protein WV34_14855 [Bacillus amyloliquefaciens]MDQ8092537.1 hypothetical protein [Bacillus amyloliquefaciens]